MTRQSAGQSPRWTTNSLLTILSDASEALGRGTDIRTATTGLLNELRTLSGARSVSLFLGDGRSMDFRMSATTSEELSRTEGVIQGDRPPVNSFSLTAKPLHLTARSKYFAELRETVFKTDQVGSIDIAPLRFRNELIGVVVFTFEKGNGFPSEVPQAEEVISATGLISLVIATHANGGGQAMLEEKYPLVLDQISSAVFIFELSSGKIVEANRAFFGLFGYDPSDLVRLTLSDILFDPQESFEEGKRHSSETGDSHIPSKFCRHRNGFPIEVEIRGTHITRGGAGYAVITVIDLTDRRKAELEAGIQRVRYENFIRNSAEGIWRIEFSDPIDVTRKKEDVARDIVDRGVIAECNHALAAMYGFDDPEQLIGKHASDFIADLEQYSASKLRFVEEKLSITNIETVEKDQRGNIHYFENSYIGETEGGKLVRMWGIQRDISEKRRLQERLRTSENRYRNLVEQANDMVLLFNDRAEFVFANKKFFEQTGYAADEIWEKPVSVVAHPEDASLFMAKFHEQIQFPERHLRHTMRFLTKFNEVRIVEFSMTTLRAADHAADILAIGRDVTVEQAVENALHESEEKYRSLVEHSLLSVLVIQDDVIVYANPTAASLFETDLSLFSGTRLDAFIHPNDYVQVFEKLAEAMAAPGRDVQFSVRALTSMGRMKWIEGWAAGITYMAKPAIQVALVDITDTKRLQEQLIQSQKMETIGQLASGVAHDFNNLLGSIYGAIEVMKRRHAPQDENLKKYVDILETSARRAAELTSQLLTFSRQRESDIKPVRLNDIVNDAMKILIRSIGKDIKVEYSLDPGLQVIEADASQIEGVVMNLSINSRDAMPSGGILRIETSNVEFDTEITRQIPDARPGRYACLSVSDTGTGMDEDTRRRIFEPFFTTKPIGKGTGLGLSIVYGIVKNHKGFINVYSEQGHGTTFKLYFPGSDKTPVDDEKRTQKEIPHGTETILIIDDEATLLDLTRELLSGLGYKVITAEGALRGIKTYRELYSEIDMVMLDMLMPDMTGSEVFPVLRNINPRASVLLATGLSVGEKVEEMVSRGVNDIIAKPYSMADLAVHVRKVLDSAK